MESKENPKYALGTGVFASPRLDLQCFQISQALGGHILDPVVPQDTTGLKIADVACGTGYFLLNVKTDPSTELHAFDVDLSRLPHDTFFPNVQRHVWNINDPPPAEFISTFDIVQIQLVWAFTFDTNIDKCFRNILALVKPGGYIQWTESIVGDEQWISPDPNYTPQFLPHFFAMAYTLYGAPRQTWTRVLDDVFERNGVDVLKVHRASLEPKNYKSWTLQQCTAWEELLAFMRTTVHTNERKEKVQEFADLLQKCHWEAQVKGVADISPLIRVVGRKKA